MTAIIAPSGLACKISKTDKYNDRQPPAVLASGSRHAKGSS